MFSLLLRLFRAINSNLSPNILLTGKSLIQVSSKANGGTWTLDKDGIYVALGIAYADAESRTLKVSQTSGLGSIIHHIDKHISCGNNTYAFTSYDLIDGKIDDVYRAASNMSSAKITLYRIE